MIPARGPQTKCILITITIAIGHINNFSYNYQMRDSSFQPISSNVGLQFPAHQLKCGALVSSPTAQMWGCWGFALEASKVAGALHWSPKKKGIAKHRGGGRRKKATKENLHCVESHEAESALF